MSTPVSHSESSPHGSTNHRQSCPTITLPKFSINVLELRTKQALVATSPQAQQTNILKLSLPDRVPADRAIEAWVIASDPKAKLPYLQSIETIHLSIDGPASLSQTSQTG